VLRGVEDEEARDLHPPRRGLWPVPDVIDAGLGGDQPDARYVFEAVCVHLVTRHTALFSFNDQCELGVTHASMLWRRDPNRRTSRSSRGFTMRRHQGLYMGFSLPKFPNIWVVFPC
jgi:hypothetical protein